MDKKKVTIIAAIAFVALLVGVLLGIGLSSLLKNAAPAKSDTASSPVVTVEEENKTEAASEDIAEDEAASEDITEEKTDDSENAKEDKAAEETVSDTTPKVGTSLKQTLIPFNAANGKVMADESGQYVKYEIIQDDVPWTNAYKDCISRGGHLLHINDMEEYEKVSKFIFDEKCDGNIFYLGGMRDLKSDKYYWVNEELDPIDTYALNKESSWCNSLWAADQPNFNDNHDNDECYIATYYSQSENRWLWSDNINDLPGMNPNTIGQIAYICEYE